MALKLFIVYLFFVVVVSFPSFVKSLSLKAKRLLLVLSSPRNTYGHAYVGRN